MVCVASKIRKEPFHWYEPSKIRNIKDSFAPRSFSNASNKIDFKHFETEFGEEDGFCLIDFEEGCF